MKTTDQRTTDIMAQLEAAAQQIFNQYTIHIRHLLPTDPMTLHTITSKKQRELYTVAQMIKQEIIREAEHYHGQEPYRPITDNFLESWAIRRNREQQARHDNWLECADLILTISGDGFSMKFPKYRIFDILENTARANNIQTNKLQKYAA